LALIVFLDLIALTWYFWAMPVKRFDETKKILTTVASWAGSVLTFLGIRYKFKKGESIEQVLALRPVQLCVIAFTFLIWFFILPFHNLSLSVTQSDLKSPLSGVTVRMDDEKLPRTGPSNERGEVKIVGIPAGPHRLCLDLTGHTTKCVNTGFMEVIYPGYVRPVTMERAEGKMEIKTTPEGAEIYLDGDEKKPVGTTNRTLTLSTGKHTVLFRKDGYRTTLWEQIAISDADNPPFERRLEDIRKRYDVIISSDPENASIYVDGNPMGSTIVTVRLTAGEHKVRIEKGGYKPIPDQVFRVPGQRILTFQLEKNVVGTTR